MRRRLTIAYFADASETFDVEDTMSSITERWLLVEELLKQRSAHKQEADWTVKAKQFENKIDDALNSVAKLSSADESNVDTLSKLQVLRLLSFQCAFGFGLTFSQCDVIFRLCCKWLTRKSVHSHHLKVRSRRIQL